MTFATGAVARVMALGGALAPPVFVASAIAATLATPGYSSVDTALSALAAPGAPAGWLIGVGFAGYGMLVQAIGPLLYALVGRRRLGRAVWGFVMAYGAGAVLAAVFRTAHAGPVLWGVSEGAVHGAVARVSFAGILALMLIVPWALRRDPSWRTWRRFSLAIAVASVALLVPFELDAWPDGRGLVQRGFFLSTMAWVEVTSLRLFRLAGARAS